MRTVLNVLNFVLGGFATTLSRLLPPGEHCAHLHPSADALLLGNHQTVPRSLWK